MAVELGEPIGLCACGCGGKVFERIYNNNGKMTRRRPVRLRGHNAETSRQRWQNRPGWEPAAPIWEYVQSVQRRFNLSWTEMTEIAGLTSQIQDIRYLKYISKERANQITTALSNYAHGRKRARHR